MISEKTVELNITAELMNLLHWKTKSPCCAIAPTQQQEAMDGFDAVVYSIAGCVYIQYKRAKRNRAGDLVWELNRTKKRDQLPRLQKLEASGMSVFYALPHFVEPLDVYLGRNELLLQTSWIPPCAINPAGGPNGHHEIHFNPKTRVWTVHSDEETPVEVGVGIEGVVASFERNLEDSTKQNIMGTWRQVFLKKNPDMVAGASMVVRY